MKVKTNIWTLILPGIIAGVFSFAGIFFGTVYTQSKAFQNKRKEALLELEKSKFEKSQKFYLDLLDFSEKCLKLTTYNEHQDINELKLPSISNDTLLNKDWLILKEKLGSCRDSVDYRVYYQFQSILGLYNNNPFPNIKFQDSILINPWYTDKLYEKWVKEAGYLKYLVNKKLNLEIEESYY